MRVDAHHHLWKIDRGDYGWLNDKDTPTINHDFLPPDIAPFLKDCGIDKTILVQCAETVAETEYLLGLAAAAPFIGGVVGWVDLAAEDAPDVIAWLAENKTLKGLRPMLQGLPEDDWILRPELAPAIAAMKATELRLDILVFPRHLPHVAKFFALHGDLPMVIDHGAKPYIARGEIEPWRSDMESIARAFPNVMCKMSGLATEAAPGWSIETLKPYVDALIDIWGPKRLMWGSDWPVLNLAGSYPDWFAIAQKLTAHLSEQDRADIFGNTAQTFYGIA
ncbi:MAG TPA: amidohydrolase family protein [Rhizomicrobium sp.]|jgi:L-fuconolactonase|nr:amidohydrolase family protein [Rhizomicrobium sp.]